MFGVLSLRRSIETLTYWTHLTNILWPVPHDVEYYFPERRFIGVRSNPWGSTPDPLPRIVSGWYSLHSSGLSTILSYNSKKLLAIDDPHQLTNCFTRHLSNRKPILHWRGGNYWTIYSRQKGA